jgi:pyruvate,water dikinase
VVKIHLWVRYIISCSRWALKCRDGFAITASAYKFFLQYNKIEDKLKNLLDTIDAITLNNLPEVPKQCREIVTQAILPDDIKKAILQSYTLLSGAGRGAVSVAVRSSATAEDLPTASFAGQHDLFLNIEGEENLLLIKTMVEHRYGSPFID